LIAIRVLIVEDEISLSRIITKRLREEGYSVDACLDGQEGSCFAEMAEYDCIILDWMLPGMDGLSLLKNLRSKGITTPVLILTARDAIEDRVAGLDTGADDYLVKPFSFDELLARLRAILRRPGESKGTTLSIADLTLDTVSHSVTRSDNILELTSKEYAVLEYLLRNKGRILTRSQIAEHVWSYDFDYSSNIVDVYIRYLRGKIDDGFDKKLIHTIRGSGYVLKEKV
jgi:heavy metal response regulator